MTIAWRCAYEWVGSVNGKKRCHRDAVCVTDNPDRLALCPRHAEETLGPFISLADYEAECAVRDILEQVKT
jgi:hypothetical protein